ncbi:MAG: hypothetical protein JNK85_28675 [Verrucomicrobiales bacterium]|nr:hypothetical protein [Verrucomicrobiales bacterium]
MGAITSNFVAPAGNSGKPAVLHRWEPRRGNAAAARCGRTQQAARWLLGEGVEPTTALWPLREPVSPSPLAADHHIAFDPTRRTVTYREPNREVTIQILAAETPLLDLESIDAWRRSDGPPTVVTDEEKVEVARRTLGYFRQHLGVRLILA